MKTLLRALAVAALFASALAFSANNGMQVTEAWSRATPPGLKVGVAYLVIRNRTGQDDVLLSAVSSRASKVELHASKVSNGISSMVHQTSLPIAAGATVKLEPGGLHFMLLGLNTALVGGERVPLTLQFAKAGAVNIDVTVRIIAE
jgi:copper(I)-binding protein